MPRARCCLTIMASLAQQESQSLSQNVKLGLQYRYQQGHVQVNHNRFLGYTKDVNGHLVIDPEQAEIVRRIYREYLEGYSMDKIAAGLEADGILTGAGKTKWHTSTINKILRNEKYIGDALLQKDLHHRLSDQKAHQEQWHRPSILRGGRPRSDYSEGHLPAGAGGAGPQTACPYQQKRQPPLLLLQALLCADGYSAVNAVSFIDAFTGTTEAASPSSGAAAAAWITPATPAAAAR